MLDVAGFLQQVLLSLSDDRSLGPAFFQPRGVYELNLESGVSQLLDSGYQREITAKLLLSQFIAAKKPQIRERVMKTGKSWVTYLTDDLQLVHRQFKHDRDAARFIKAQSEPTLPFFLSNNVYEDSASIGMDLTLLEVEHRMGDLSAPRLTSQLNSLSRTTSNCGIPNLQPDP